MVPISALTSGIVTLAPLLVVEAPTIVDSLAFGPRVTVLVQPAPKSVTAAIAAIFFMIYFILLNFVSAWRVSYLKLFLRQQKKCN